MSRHWTRTANALLGLVMMALTTAVSARIPEPDNVVYGLSRADAVLVTLEVDGEQITAYRMGDNPDAGDYYVLRVPIDSLDPQTSGTARPGDEARIYVNGETDAAATLIIGPRGTILIMHLVGDDADADGIANAIDRCPQTPPGVAVDPDGCSEEQIALSDWDEDGFTRADEIASGSDPDNPDSMPVVTTLTLREGYNQVTVPAESKGFGDLLTLMEHLGGDNVIEKLLILDAGEQKYLEAGYGETGEFYGVNPTLPLPGSGLSVIIYAKNDDTIGFTSLLCQTWHLIPGMNLVGSPCLSPGLTVKTLLQAIRDRGATVVVQRFNHGNGRFETGVQDATGKFVGKEFPIVPEEAYILHSDEEVTDFRP